MIATILQSTPTFHAVAYNEKKVKEGSAQLLEIKNFGAIDTIGYTDPGQLQDYLKQYSARNSRIKNPQFHLAISCKGHEWSPGQLLEFAHDYLEEMGYVDPDQPLLVYSHHDTDNTHIHVITSRVNPQGKKINDSKERIRSQMTIDKLLGKNMKAKAEADIKTAMDFDFTDMRQFKSILEAMKYECFETGDKINGSLCVKKGGMVLIRIPKETIILQCEKNNLTKEPDVAERMKWRSIFKRYRDQNSDVRGLEKDLRAAFGVSLVWLGSKDKPWGYQVVDFKNKKVYDGNKILHREQLCKFMSREDQIRQINLVIDATLNENPFITTRELNSKIRRFGGYVKKDFVVCNDIRIPLDKTASETLKRNNKVNWLQSFHPASVEEREILCRLTKFGVPDIVKIENQEQDSYKPKEVKRLYDILTIRDRDEKKQAFIDSGYNIFESANGHVFILNLEKMTIIDMSRTGLPKELYMDLKPQMGIKTDIGVRNSKPVSRNNGISRRGKDNYRSGQNREWEVGKKGKDRDDPDRGELMAY